VASSAGRLPEGATAGAVRAAVRSGEGLEGPKVVGISVGEFCGRRMYHGGVPALRAGGRGALPTERGAGVDDEMPDVTMLVAAAAGGDEAAWHEIVDRYTPLLVRVIHGYRLSAAELEDVAQTVWLRLIEQLGELREPKALPGWIVTTARREALRSARRMARVRPHDPLDDAWSSRLVSDDEPDAELERDARHAALLEGFALLSNRQRELLMLLAEDPPPAYAEISRRTGVPIGAIGPTRARALERLRRTPSVQALVATVEAESSRRRGS
jgi:RNA polymerase sigma factor (sigma-70 family)